MNAWIRILKVKLTSSLLDKSITFSDNVNIDISGHKYASSLKDTCTINIKNIDYSTIIQIIDGKFYDVEVWCGYRSFGEFKMFEGAVVWVSNSLDDRQSNTLILVCGSELMGKFGQSKFNLSLNSGINVYSGVSAIASAAGIKNYTMSQQMKKAIIAEQMTTSQSVPAWLNTFTDNNDAYVVNADSSGTGALFSIFDASKSNLRTIDLSTNNSCIINGIPQLTKDGLKFSMLPFFNLMCGDVVKFDNSIIDISSNDYKSNNGLYLDENGEYLIRDISYSLQNRDSNFSYNVVAKKRSLVTSYIGG